MASKSTTSKFGMSLTHNRLKVRKMDSLIQFYTQKFGMKHLSKADSTVTGEENVVHFLGFGGNEGEKFSKDVTLFELVSPKSAECEGEMVNVGGRDQVYWKIGVNMPDVDVATSRLRAAGLIVGDPGQFRDIGYLCHLQDPDSYSIELLQFYFEGRKKPYKELLTHPLGQQPVFGMITLRVSDIEKSLKFYRDMLGMKVLCKEDVSMFGFHLYFLAFTDEEPPNSDVTAEENREWTYQRSYTVLELQAYITTPKGLGYTEVGSHQYGFLGLGMGTTDLSALRQHLESNQLRPTAIEENPVFSKPSFTVQDPDGIPVRFLQF